MALTELEQAFAENLILLGAATGPQLLHPILLKNSDPRPLWEIVDGFGVAGPQVVAEARTIAEHALEACGPQGFSFSEGATVGGWELVATRGKGAGGELWSAQSDGQEATLRLIPPGTGHDPERAVRFVDRSNAGLDPPHPAILKIDQADEDFGWLYTVTVGMDCRSLAGLRAPGPLPEPTALALAQSVAGSLAVVHDLGVVHGGLTPLGILIRDQRIYLTDFGLCGGQLDGTLEGCRPGGRLGLLLYASPGLIGGDSGRGLDARDDLYGLGAVILYSVLAPGAGDQRASPQEPWLVEPPVSDGFKVVLRRLLSLNPEGNYPDARSLMEDLQRVAEGGMPFALPSGGGGARGRRSESAIPQDLIRAELFERVKRAGESASDLEFVAPPAQDVLVEVEPEVGDEKGFGESTFADDMPDFPEPVGDRPSKVSSRRLKAPAARSRSDRAEIVPRKKGGGWAVFGFALLVVLGGGGVGVGVARPVGVELGQTLLGRAEAALAEGKPDYSVAWAQTEQGLDAGKRDVGLVRELIGLQRGIERRAEHERLGLHPEGKETRDPAALKPILAALELLLIRTRGLPAEFLVQFDIYLGEKQGNRHFWGELADNLLAVGEVDEALVAYMKAGSKKGEALARHALTELAFLPGGAYVVRDAGEAGKEIFGHREPSYVGRTEVTRGQYTSFLRATAKLEDKHTHCDMQLEPVDKDHTPKGWTPGVDAEVHLPATGVDMHDAVAYCAWRGGTLIDPESFAAAARGRLGFEYPWGKGAPTLGFVNAGGLLGGVAPSGCFPGGAGEGGSLDLLGSVEEWTTQVDGGRSALYGGHYDTALDQVSVSASGDAALDERRATLGFRLLRFVKAPAR